MTSDQLLGTLAVGAILLTTFLYLAYSIGRAVERDCARERAEREAKRAAALDKVFTAYPRQVK